MAAASGERDDGGARSAACRSVMAAASGERDDGGARSATCMMNGALRAVVGDKVWCLEAVSFGGCVNAGDESCTPRSRSSLLHEPAGAAGVSAEPLFARCGAWLVVPSEMIWGRRGC